MTKLTIAFAAAATLLAGPALAGLVSGNAPLTVNPITEAQVSIELGPNHSRWESRERWEGRGHSRWESRGERRRCKTITVHRESTSRSKTITKCRDSDDD
jgi:hypothetical protein